MAEDRLGYFFYHCGIINQIISMKKVVFISCNGNHSVVGIWQLGSISEEEMPMTFNEDGSCERMKF